MAPSTPSQSYDLIFAGGGFSAAITLTYVLQELGGRWKAGKQGDVNPGDGPLKIAVFDKADRFPKGIAYSEDENSGAFLITPASEMMPPLVGGGNAFTAWLSQNPGLWADRLAKSWNATVNACLPSLRAAVDQHDYEHAFFPRSVVGWFVEDLVNKAITDAETAGYAQVDILPLEVERVQRIPKDLSILVSTATHDDVEANQLVVAIGSGQFGSLCHTEQVSECLITAPLENGVSALRNGIESRLQAYVGESGPKVLIIGSNASALDTIKVLLELHHAHGLTAQITCMSPSGQFPAGYRTITAAHPDPDPCDALLDLIATNKQPTAQKIYDCATKDRQILVEDGKHIGEAKALIYDHVLKLIGRLEASEKVKFVEVYGNDLSRQFYMTSPIYAEIYRGAISTGAVKLTTGKVNAIKVSGQGAEVEYEAVKERKQDRYNLVIDCSGFEFPLKVSSVSIVKSLFEDLKATQNRSGRGFKARPDSFEIAQNVYVLGPLYAGNVDSTGVCRWHLETTRGISEIAKICATNLVDKMPWPIGRL